MQNRKQTVNTRSEPVRCSCLCPRDRRMKSAGGHRDSSVSHRVVRLHLTSEDDHHDPLSVAGDQAVVERRGGKQVAVS